MSLGEVMVKPTTMIYRNFLAMETEELLRNLPIDGAVLLGGYDKTTPGLVMGKELAVQRVKDGESIATVVKELGLGDQTLRNWVKAAAEGKLKGAGSKVMTPEAMELSRLRAELPG
jgi:dihydroxyacid dehydratase/phosphogluconate dehydratase